MITANHPRLFLNADRLARCQALRLAGDPRYARLRTVSEGYLTPGNPYGEPSLNLALMYQLTHEPQWAARAIELARPLAQAGTYALTHAVNGVGQASAAGYNVRLVLLILAVTYDWCDGAFSLADAQLFRNALKADADWIWPETNPSRQGAYAIANPGDNFYHGFLMGSWLAHLALGDADGLARDRNRYATEVVPHNAKYQAGGYFLEGTSYGCETLMRMGYYLDAHFTATGEDLRGGFPFAAAHLLPYLTTPPRDRLVPAGDQAREPLGLIADPTRAAVMLAASATSPSALNAWLNYVSPNRQQWPWDAWQELLWGAPGAGTGSPAALASGVQHNGGTLSRGGWGPQDTLTAITCGPGRESHQDRAAGTFSVFQGDWLTAKAGLWGGFGILRETEYHNCLLVPPFHQPEFAAQEPAIQSLIEPAHNSPRVEAFTDTAELSYTRMELAGAYAYYQWNDDPLKRVQRPLTTYRREILWLKPDVWLIHDQVETNDPKQEVAWCLQTPTPPALRTAGDYVNADLSGRSLLPAGALLRVVPAWQPPGGAPTSYRTEIRPPAGSRNNRFLQVLATGINTSRLLPSGTGTVAFLAELGDTLVIGYPSVLPVTVSTAARRILVLGLLPEALVNLSFGGVPLAARADAGGLATFALSSTSSPRGLRLTDGNAPPPPRRVTVSLLSGPAAGPSPGFKGALAGLELGEYWNVEVVPD